MCIACEAHYLGAPKFFPIRKELGVSLLDKNIYDNKKEDPADFLTLRIEMREPRDTEKKLTSITYDKYKKASLATLTESI